MKARKITDYIQASRVEKYEDAPQVIAITLDWMHDIHERAFFLHQMSSIEESNRSLFYTFNGFRKYDSYYKNLIAKLQQGTKLEGFEYFYFTLVTENINHLELAALENLEEQFKYEEFLPNFNILLAVRRWQEETDPEKKSQLNQKLREAFNERGNLPLNRKHDLNLRGVNLAGADLSMTNLEYVDFTDAILNHCDFNGAIINGSCLDGADLSHSTFTGTLTYTRAEHACFDDVKVENACWDQSQFTGSSFKNAVIDGVTFNKSRLDECDFTNAILRMYENNSCLLRKVNLIGCTIFLNDLDTVTIWGEKIFHPDAFTSVDRFREELNGVNERIMLPIHSSNKNQPEKSALIRCWQTWIASNLLEQIEESTLGNDDKIAFINAALDHDIFMPENYVTQLAYRAERSIYALFATNKRECFTTFAIRSLEHGRDRFLAPSLRGGIVA